MKPPSGPKKQTQFKPNLPDVQMSVNSILTRDYERNDIFAVPENKANSNPNKPNLETTPGQVPSTELRARFCAL